MKKATKNSKPSPKVPAKPAAKKVAPAPKKAAAKSNSAVPAKKAAKKVAPAPKPAAKKVAKKVAIPAKVVKTTTTSKKEVSKTTTNKVVVKKEVTKPAKAPVKSTPESAPKTVKNTGSKPGKTSSVAKAPAKALPVKKIAQPVVEEEEVRKPVIRKNITLTQAIAGQSHSLIEKDEINTVTRTKSKYLRYELEFLVHSSARLLFEFISTPSGLSEWFADDINFRNDLFTFIWDKAEQKARLLQLKEGKSVRFQWIEEPKDTFFEFRIEVDDLTGDVALIITDFAENEVSKDAAILLWNSQIESLLKAIGSY